MNAPPLNARQKLLAKIKALLSKTVANGCTEGEAMSALDLARKLMAEFEVTDTDLTFGGEACEINTAAKDDRDDIRARLAAAVGKFCGCLGYKNGIERIAYLGLYSDTVFAHWLLDTLEAYVKRELQNWFDAYPSRYRVRRLETRGFLYGCIDRLVERLYALAAERATGTDIALKKNELIATTMANAGIVLRDRFTLRQVDTRANRDGIAAGDRATFDKPMTEAEKPKAIQ